MTDKERLEAGEVILLVSETFVNGELVESYRREPRFGFETTREMDAWIDATTFDGPCCTVDNWTWGRILITPTPRSYREGLVEKHFIAKDWTTAIEETVLVARDGAGRLQQIARYREPLAAILERVDPFQSLRHIG